jgi:PAS domain S-box-containing protein
METANITYQDEDGSIKVKVDYTKCISCGRCVSACKHDARYFEDDAARFFGDLSNGVQISLIAAPSIRTNIPEYKRLFTYLKNLGVRKIYDVSLGADICVWAYVRYIEKYDPKPMIAQPCPAIVSYCEMYRHDLLEYLSPVQSPMASVCIYMKEYEGVTDRIAALSPCLAKANEFEDTGLAQYNVTFQKMLAYIKENNIRLPEEETEFDHYESGLGSLFPMPGGLKENLEFFMGKALRIDRFEGKGVYQKLDSFGKTDEDFLPRIFDVLSCDGGCNEGPACPGGNNFFEIGSVMDKRRTKANENFEKNYLESLHKIYDKTFDLTRFLRKYSPVELSLPGITEEDIQSAFKLLGKTDKEKQNVDCNACGSDTCYEMARKIALGVNIPVNCVVKSRDDAHGEHEKNLIALEENVRQTAIVRDTLEQFETIWDSVESGIVIIDAETREILNINPTALNMLGHLNENVVGKQCNEVFCTADKCPILELNQTIDRSERQVRKADGTFIPIIKSAAKIHYNGRLALLENFTDVSYIKEAEEQKRLLEITEQANRAKSAFLANMSHEIRTPMNAIIGMTSIAELSDSIERKDYAIGKIKDASTHLLGVINDILDVSKIEAGKFELSPIEFNFTRMFRRVVNVNKYRIDEKRQSFTVDIDKEIPDIIFADEQRLAQVITNLLGNAVKFTPELGSIKIETKFVGEENGLAAIQISVIDSGIGISSEQQQRLFQPFSQAESGTSRKFGGTGLGLVISKNIIEQMGGRIWVESELGKGAAFIFTIQVKRVESEQNVSRELNGVRILAADRDPLTLEYIRGIAKQYGASCDIAASGEDVCKLADGNGGYDIVFIDYSMRGIDDIWLTKAFMENESGSGKPRVVMMSEVEWDKPPNAVKETRVDKFLFKPVLPSDIADSINELLGTVKANRQDTARFKDRRILLAEDVEINREIVLSLLEPTLIEIECAVNGGEAVDMFRADPDRYDMIFMDVQMPKVDGYEATRRIRALDTPKAKDIPIIAMTANVFREDVEHCLEAGMNGHIGKPLDVEEVFGLLQDYFG